MLNHLNLCSADVPALADVFVRHLGFTVMEAGTMPVAAAGLKAESAFATLRDTHGFFLVLTAIDGDAGARTYPAGFHFGLRLDGPEAVRAKHAALRGAGLTPTDIQNFEAMGAGWTSFTCPLGDGLVVEINHATRLVAALVARS